MGNCNCVKDNKNLDIQFEKLGTIEKKGNFLITNLLKTILITAK